MSTMKYLNLYETMQTLCRKLVLYQQV